MLLLVAPVVMGQVGGHAQGVLVWAQLAQDVAASFMLAAFFARSLAGADFAVPPASTLRSDRPMASAADSVLGAMETALKEYQTVDKFDARQFLIRPKKTPDEEKNRAAKAHFIAKLNVLIALHKLPEGDTHVALNDLTDKVAKLGREHSGFLNCKTFGQIPTASKGALMQKSAPSLQLTDAIISRLDKEDPMAIGNLFHFVFGVPDTVPLPAVLQELVVLQRTLRKRASDISRPCKQWLDGPWEKIADGESVLDWSECRCYKLVFPLPMKDDKVRIVHVSGTFSEVPDGLSLSPQTEILDNCIDSKACIMIGKRALLLKDWFPKGLGPNDKTLVNSKNTIVLADADKFKKQLMAESARTSSAQVSATTDLANEFAQHQKERLRAQAAARKPPAGAPAKRRRSSGSCAGSVAPPMQGEGAAPAGGQGSAPSAAGTS